MAPKMDQIYEDGGEEFEGTFKVKKSGNNYGNNNSYGGAGNGNGGYGNAAGI